MRCDPRWIVVDLTGLKVNNGTDLTIHSADGTPIERGLRRSITPRRGAEPDLQLDKEAAGALLRYVRSLDLDNPVDGAATFKGLHVAHHFVTHPEFGALSVAVWMHETPPPEPPLLNSWVLDLDELATVTAGDDVSILPDGREAGETRPVQDLWRYIQPEDAAVLVRRYAEALANPPGSWMSIEWTLRPPDSDPVHLFSGGRIFLKDNDVSRVIAGTSALLTERTQISQDVIEPIAEFSGITLALVNWRIPAAITSIGSEAPLSNQALATLVSVKELPDGQPHQVTLDGKLFLARSVPINNDPKDAAMVLLRRED